MGGLRLGHIFGIELRLDLSLVVIFGLIVMSLGAGTLLAWHPDWSPALRWGVAVAAAVLFLASVVVHELSHALVARATGLRVRHITLFLFGGVASIEGEPRSPGAEAGMAIVGPITSVLLGVTFLLLGGWLARDVTATFTEPRLVMAHLGPAATLMAWLGPVNIIVGLFNMIPAFPLDGGRVLRAALWKATGDVRKATSWAAALGQLCGILLMLTGVAMAFGLWVPFLGTGLVGGMWLAFIGWFLTRAAGTSQKRQAVESLLERVPVRRLMHVVDSVPPGLTVERLVERLEAWDERAIPVTESGSLVGVVSVTDLSKVARSEWGHRQVRDIMTPSASLPSLAPDDPARDAFRSMTDRGVEQIPILEHGVVRGLIGQRDIRRYVELHASELAPSH